MTHQWLVKCNVHRTGGLKYKPRNQRSKYICERVAIVNVILLTTDQFVCSAKKLYLYSCHDTSLVPILISMGCFDNKWPDYAAGITFEVYVDKKKDHWVKVLYAGKVMFDKGLLVFVIATCNDILTSCTQMVCNVPVPSTLATPFTNCFD